MWNTTIWTLFSFVPEVASHHVALQWPCFRIILSYHSIWKHIVNDIPKCDFSNQNQNIFDKNTKFKFPCIYIYTLNGFLIGFLPQFLYSFVRQSLEITRKTNVSQSTLTLHDANSFICALCWPWLKLVTISCKLKI